MNYVASNFRRIANPAEREGTCLLISGTTEHSGTENFINHLQEENAYLRKLLEKATSK
jgi:hypothetical protein